MRSRLIPVLAFFAFLSCIVSAQDALNKQDSASDNNYLSYAFSLEATMKGHKGPVGSVVFSPDGRFIASGSGDDTVKLWKGDSGKSIKALMRHPAPILCVAFSPDSNVLAAGSENGTTSLWEVNYKERIRILKDHEGRVWSVKFSPDGKILASGSADKTIILWDMSSGKAIRTLKGHEGAVHSLAFSPDGKTLASGSADGTVRTWNVSSGKNLLTMKEPTGGVNSISFSPDGGTLASGSRSGVITLWNPATGKEKGTLSGHEDAIGINDCLAFGLDGRILASGSSDKRILVWDLSSGKIITEVQAHEDSINSINFSPNGRAMVSGGLDGDAKLWKIQVTESLGTVLKTEYVDWQRGILKLSADVMGLADVVKFQYTLDGTTWLDIAEDKDAPYAVDWDTRTPISSPSKNVRVRVVAERAAGGRATDMSDSSFSVDNEPPKTEHNFDGAIHKESFSINLSANDGNGIGLADTRYRINHGKEMILRWNGQPKITQEGANTLEYWSADKLGNEEKHKTLTDMILDKTAPEFFGWSKEPSSLKESFSGPLRVSLQVTDKGGSGLTGKIPQIDYHIDSEAPYEGYKDMSAGGDNVWYYDIPEPPEGWDHHKGKSIYYKARCEDAAGNVARSAEQQELIAIPEVPPTVRIMGSFGNWVSGKLALTAEASDADGTIKSVGFEYSLDNTAWTPIKTVDTPPYSVEWDTAADIPEVAGTVWVRASALDSDDLPAKYDTPSFGVDNQPPVTEHDYDGAWHKTDFVINLEADDGEGSDVAAIKYKINGSYEKDVQTNGQPQITDQGINALEYWSIDASGNEEAHKTLSGIKLDRIPPFFADWRGERTGSIIHFEVKIVDADSGINSPPQFDAHVGSDTKYLGYKDMVDAGNGLWKYDMDISGQPAASGQKVLCKASAKDAVGNLGIDRWEYEITGVIEPTPIPVTEVSPEKPVPDESVSETPIPPKPEPEKELDIKPVVPVAVEEQKKESSIVWALGTSAKGKVGEKVRVQGEVKPQADKPVPVNISVVAPDDTVYVSQMDTDLNGAFQFSLPLTSKGTWQVLANWAGDDEYSSARSKALVYEVTSEEKEESPDAAKKSVSRLKSSTIIIGIVFIYAAIIGLYRE